MAQMQRLDIVLSSPFQSIGVAVVGYHNPDFSSDFLLFDGINYGLQVGPVA
jgi:hypothetical protein